MQFSGGYTVAFATFLCLVCAAFVTGSALGLEDRQAENALADRNRIILAVAGVLDDSDRPDNNEIDRLFKENIRAEVVELKSGKVDASIDIASFDPAKERSDPQTSAEAPANGAQVKRVPKRALIYKQVDGGGNTIKVMLPIVGNGLWDLMQGYIALDGSGERIEGIAYYYHRETPGLGGEVDNPGWKAKWVGRQAFGNDGEVAIKVVKGAAGPVADAPYSVDGLSGATITSRGVTAMLKFWLGEAGFGPYLQTIKQG